MDFWHCHKPHDAEKKTPRAGTQDGGTKIREGAAGGKGVGIGGYVAQQGVGLVDLSFFLVNRRDCEGVVIKVR